MVRTDVFLVCWSHSVFGFRYSSRNFTPFQGSSAAKLRDIRNPSGNSQGRLVSAAVCSSFQLVLLQMEHRLFADASLFPLYFDEASE